MGRFSGSFRFTCAIRGLNGPIAALKGGLFFRGGFGIGDRARIRGMVGKAKGPGAGNVTVE